MSEMDARKALKKIISKLTDAAGYYVWTGLGDPPVWLLRVPRTDKATDDNWQKPEKADIIHVCRPSKFLEALEKNKREDMTVYSGYVADSKCVRCQRETPEDIERKMTIQIKLHTLGQRVG
jgi:hypothetical protein